MLQDIKTALLRAGVDGYLSWLHALRFVYLLKTGKPDPEVRLLERFLVAGDIAVDVGANGANWTIALTAAVGPKGEVFAFEADPYYAQVTTKTLRLIRNKNVHFFPFGLGERDEAVQFRMFDDSGQRLSGRSGVCPKQHTDRRNGQLVKLYRLDGMVVEYPQLYRCRFIKCDVEGFELFVFRGAQDILDRARPIVVLEAGDFSEHGYSADELYSHFSSRNYLAFALNKEFRLEETNESLSIPSPISINRILIPQEQIGSVRDLLK